LAFEELLKSTEILRMAGIDHVWPEKQLDPTGLFCELLLVGDARAGRKVRIYRPMEQNRPSDMQLVIEFSQRGTSAMFALRSQRVDLMRLNERQVAALILSSCQRFLGRGFKGLYAGLSRCFERV
jgi:hypothetical protein